jgi:hypothetical protein
MLLCLVRFRSHPRFPSWLGNLFAAPPYIPISLPPYFLFHRRLTKDPSPQLLYILYLLLIALSPLAATLMDIPASVANKGLNCLAKPFRCNTYKKHGGKGSRLWLTRNPIRITVLSNHRERRSTCVPTMSGHESRVTSRRVAPLPSECYDLVFHDPC